MEGGCGGQCQPLVKREDMQEYARETARPAPPENITSPTDDAEAAYEEGAEQRDVIVRRAEVVISNVLRGGVLLSALIIAAGVALFYVRRAQSGLPDHPYPDTLPAIWSGLTQGSPIAIIALGLLLLLATPVVRVAVSIFAFSLERDWRYVAITVLVLAILIASFFLGKGGA